jgi:putative endonuclease
MTYSTYILHSQASGRFYIGQTQDLEKRLAKHNAGYVKSTKAYKPWKLVWHQTFQSRSEAFQLEKKLKSFKKRDYILKWIEENPVDE